jgi:hypothetical protein
METAKGFFDHVPRSVGGHFVINLYAAIFRVLDQTRSFAELGGTTLESVFERYAFLGEYFMEMRQHMPEELTWEGGAAWWRRELDAWEKACDFHLPLRALSQQAALPFQSRLAFMAIGLVEEDSRFGTLLAELQAPLTHRRPTLELVGQMMMEPGAIGETDPWTICRPLINAGLVEILNKQAPRSEWLLRVPPLLWDAVRGQVTRPPAPWCKWHDAQNFTAIDALVFDQSTLDKLQKIPALLAAERARVLILRGAPGADSVHAAGSVAGALGRSLLEVNGSELSNPEPAQLLGPFCALANALPCLHFDLAPGETAKLPALVGYSGPIAILLGLEGGVDADVAEASLTLTLPALRPEHRERLWRDTLQDPAATDLRMIVDGFHLGGAYIRKVARAARAQAALDDRTQVRVNDVRTAARMLNRQMLDTLAVPLTVHGSWSDLVSVQATREKLQELERRCRHS